MEWRIGPDFQTEGEQHKVQLEWRRFREERGRNVAKMVCLNQYFSAFFTCKCTEKVFCQWDDDSSFREKGFDRGSENWWRQQHYYHEFVGSNGVQSMAAVQLALKTLGVSVKSRVHRICTFFLVFYVQVSDSGDASAIRAAYLKMVSLWHPDRFQREEERKVAAEMFRNVTDAYNLLKEIRD